MNYIAFQYAEALFGLALESKQISEITLEFKSLTEILDTEIYNFLIHPKIKKEAKKEILSDFIKNDLLKHFVFVLIDNLRIESLEEILIEFEKIVDNQRKILKVQVFSYKLLLPEQKKQLIENLGKKHNRKIELKNIVDKSIVGGIRIEFEGMILDDTINNYLHNLKANLMK